MWWPDGQWYEAHNTAGAQSSGTRWAIAEGEAGGARGAQTFLLVANVSDQPANIRVTVMTDTGVAIAWPSASTTFAVPARSRHTVPVDASLFPNLDAALRRGRRKHQRAAHRRRALQLLQRQRPALVLRRRRPGEPTHAVKSRPHLP